MIRLSLDAAITLYFVLIVSFILLSWCIHAIRSKKKKKLFFSTSVNRCEYCACTYMERSELKTTKCPTCGSYNSKE